MQALQPLQNGPLVTDSATSRSSAANAAARPMRGLALLAPRWRTRRAKVCAAALLLGACWGASEPAWADCTGPEPVLRWSYPMNGAINVPTNADLFFTGSVYGVPTLDGEPLERLAANVYELGELAPQTTYEIRWQTAVIAFTTGDGPARETPPGLLSNDVLLERGIEHGYRCPIVEPQGCFDTGPPLRVEWDPGQARVFVVEKLHCDGSTTSMVWPGECGPPVLENYDPIVCARVRGSNGGGLSDATDVVCSVPNVSLDTIPRYNTCVGAWPPADATTVPSEQGVTVGAISGVQEGEATAGVDEMSMMGSAAPRATTPPPSSTPTTPTAPTTPMDAATSKTGCSIAHTSQRGSSWPSWLGLAGLGLCALRRRARLALGGATKPHLP